MILVCFQDYEESGVQMSCHNIMKVSGRKFSDTWRQNRLSSLICDNEKEDPY